MPLGGFSNRRYNTLNKGLSVTGLSASVLYSFSENPRKIRPVASDNLLANLVLCLLVNVHKKIQEEYE